ncbi:MAG: hypothetical protein RBT65_15070, partial [Methanolobus sp.]|nr:hypothetical protein [Methanolobus sp.]
MKKILLVAEFVGREGHELTDEKMQVFVRRFSDENEIHVYCKEFLLNESGDYIRAKGVQIHTAENGSIIYAPKEYDNVVALDDWANQNIAMFTAQVTERHVQNDFTAQNEAG